MRLVGQCLELAKENMCGQSSKTSLLKPMAVILAKKHHFMDIHDPYTVVPFIIDLLEFPKLLEVQNVLQFGPQS